MWIRKDSISTAVLALLASVGFAYGETAAPVAPSLTLDRQALRLDDAAAPQGLLMQGLDKIGVGSTLEKYGITIGGYFDSGYIWNHRNHTHTMDTSGGTSNAIAKPNFIPMGSGAVSGKIGGGGFNVESHNNYCIDAIDLQFARAVDASKGNWDVGGLVEVMYGADAAAIHSDGLEYGNSVPFNDRFRGGTTDRYHPQDQFDIPQAYLDIVTPVKGLKVRVGKFDTLMGYETINPNTTPFYSHSYIFDAEPFTHTGVVLFYQVNDQLGVAAGVTRGWDQALKDNNGSPDGIFQITYKVNKQWTVSLQGTVGPENTDDTAHWRIAPDLTTTYAVNDKLTLGAEAIYIYDGGYNPNYPGTPTNDTLQIDNANLVPAGSYGDVWGLALYASYKVDDHFTINFRGEKLHDYRAGTSVSTSFPYPVVGSGAATNWYEATLGVTITPMPKDRFLSGVKIRPEIRYDYNDTQKAFPAGINSSFKDQLTFGADLIINF